MNNEKMYLNIAPGCNEVVIREGKAPAQLEPKAPIRIDIAGTGCSNGLLKKSPHQDAYISQKRKSVNKKTGGDQIIHRSQ